MIDLKDFRENPGKYRRAAELKRVTVDVDQVVRLDAERLGSQRAFERLRAEQNKSSRQLAALTLATERRAAMARVAELKAQVKEAEDRTRAIELDLLPLLLSLPQPPDADVPVGKDDTENVEVKKWGEIRRFEFPPKDHATIGAELGLIDIERGVKLAGSRSYFLTGLGTLLHLAVLRLALDMMVDRDFIPMTVPVLVRDEAMTGTGYFPVGRDQAYAMSNDHPPTFLIGTAEVALTAAPGQRAYFCIFCNYRNKRIHLPGAMRPMRAAYGWIARHRSCANGACELHVRGRLHHGLPRSLGFLPILILPVVALLLASSMPRWGFMWAMAFALYAGCKWLTYREARARGAEPDPLRVLGYLLAWPGMDATAFLEGTGLPVPPLPSEWMVAALKTLLGAMLIWVVARTVLPINPLLAGWLGMVGLIFVLHFGTFHLLSLGWRRIGVSATPVMQNPLRSSSLAEFWGRRWNTAFHELATRFTFRPLRSVVGGGSDSAVAGAAGYSPSSSPPARRSGSFLRRSFETSSCRCWRSSAQPEGHL